MSRRIKGSSGAGHITEKVGSNAGGGRNIPTGAKDASAAPQHGIDVALAQAALAKVERRFRSQCMHAGQRRQILARMVRVARGICLDLSRDSWHTMSPNQRKFCINEIEDPQEVERITKLHTVENASFGPLPKKPPTPMRFDDGDDN